MRKKIEKYITDWETKAYKDGIPDEAPPRLEQLNKVPSYKTLVRAIIKNDINLISLGYSTIKCEAYSDLKKIELRERDTKLKDMAAKQVSYFLSKTPNGTHSLKTFAKEAAVKEITGTFDGCVFTCNDGISYDICENGIALRILNEPIKIPTMAMKQVYDTKKVDGLNKAVYTSIAPFIMSSEGMKYFDNYPVTTSKDHEWYIMTYDNSMYGFASTIGKKDTFMIRNMYINEERGKVQPFDNLLKAVLAGFDASECKTASAYVKTTDIEHFKKHGFELTKEGKNWSTMHKTKSK